MDKQEAKETKKQLAYWQRYLKSNSVRVEDQIRIDYEIKSLKESLRLFKEEKELKQ